MKLERIPLYKKITVVVFIAIISLMKASYEFNHKIVDKEDVLKKYVEQFVNNKQYLKKIEEERNKIAEKYKLYKNVVFTKEEKYELRNTIKNLCQTLGKMRIANCRFYNETQDPEYLNVVNFSLKSSDNMNAQISEKIVDYILNKYLANTSYKIKDSKTTGRIVQISIYKKRTEK